LGTDFVEFYFFHHFYQFFIGWQSGESSPFVLKRNTSILYPFSAIMRATARASPPLFPGPAKIVTGVSVFHLSVMAFVKRLLHVPSDRLMQ